LLIGKEGDIAALKTTPNRMRGRKSKAHKTGRRGKEEPGSADFRRLGSRMETRKARIAGNPISTNTLVLEMVSLKKPSVRRKAPGGVLQLVHFETSQKNEFHDPSPRQVRRGGEPLYLAVPVVPEVTFLVSFTGGQKIKKSRGTGTSCLRPSAERVPAPCAELLQSRTIDRITPLLSGNCRRGIIHFLKGSKSVESIDLVPKGPIGCSRLFWEPAKLMPLHAEKLGGRQLHQLPD